jgi:phosphoserine phosphatase RsbU/P
MSAQPEQALQPGQGVAVSQAHPAADDGFQANRLAAVDATELVVSASEGAFERLTRLAALLLDAPVAFVTVVDTTRSWYRTCVGLGPHAERFAAVEASFCRHVVEGGVRSFLTTPAKTPAPGPTTPSSASESWRGPGSRYTGPTET